MRSQRGRPCGRGRVTTAEGEREIVVPVDGEPRLATLDHPVGVRDAPGWVLLHGITVKGARTTGDYLPTLRLASLLPPGVARRTTITRLLGHTKTGEAERLANPLAHEARAFAAAIHGMLGMLAISTPTSHAA